MKEGIKDIDKKRQTWEQKFQILKRTKWKFWKKIIVTELKQSRLIDCLQ
jgi:hypothetical protein